MVETNTATGWLGYELVDRDGDKIGSITDIFLDRETNEPEWATVKTGLFGLRQTFVPIGDATNEGDIVRIPFEKGHVQDAPNVDPGQELSHAEERELYDHYGLDYQPERGDEREPDDEPRSPSPEEGERGVAVPGQTDADHEDDEADEADEADEDDEAPRLKRYVVTEEVRVQREELHVERDE